MDLEENLQIGNNFSSQNQTDGNDYNDVIVQLTREKEQLVAEGRYLEAENVKLRINELKGNMTGQKKKDLDFQHAQEMQNLEENFNKEIFELNQRWDLTFNDFGEKAKKTEENINIKHKAEMEELVQSLDAKLPRQVKFSREYLDLKQSEMNLVKQERYVEAHFIKSKCDVMERNETEKHNKERNEKMKTKTEQLAQKQNLERNALKQKLDIEYEIMKKEKNDEMGKIVLKYKNRKIDLEAQQKQEKYLAENENQLKAKTASVRYSNTIKNFNSSSSNYRSSPQKLKYYQTEMKMKELARGTFKKTEENKDNGVKYVSSLNDNYYVSENDKYNSGTENNHYAQDSVEHNADNYNDDMQGNVEYNNNNNDYANHVEVDGHLEQHEEVYNEQDNEGQNYQQNYEPTHEQINEQPYEENNQTQENQNEEVHEEYLEEPAEDGDHNMEN